MKLQISNQLIVEMFDNVNGDDLHFTTNKFIRSGITGALDGHEPADEAQFYHE